MAVFVRRLLDDNAQLIRFAVSDKRRNIELTRHKHTGVKGKFLVVDINVRGIIDALENKDDLLSFVFFANRKGCFIHPKTVFHPFGFDGIHLVIRVFDKAGGKQILLDAARHFGVDPRCLRNERHARFHRFALQGCIRPITSKLPIGQFCDFHRFPPSSLLFCITYHRKARCF